MNICITREHLETLGACKEGLKEFDALFGTPSPPAIG